MKLLSLRTFVLFVLLTLKSGFFAQQFNPMKHIFSQDSIWGFDEKTHNAIAVSLHLYGDEYQAYMYQQKRVYINEKYKLEFPVIEEQSLPGGRYGTSTINNAPCVNEGFEQNSFNGWAITQGTNGSVFNGTLMTACVTNPCTTTIGTGSLASIVSTPYSDAFLGQVIPNSPFAGNKVARLNTQTISNPFTFPVVKIAQTFDVTPTNSFYEFAYYAVMDATSSHTCCDQPYMYVKVRDNFGNIQTGCPIFSITVPGSGCSGTGATNWVTSGGITRSNGWQKYSIDLQNANWMGADISIEVTVGHCQYGGHYGYAYFDSQCNSFNVTVNSNTIVAPSPAPVTVTAPCATTATLSAPGGMAPYLWNGPGVVGVTTQSITASIAGNYSVSMNPLGVCNTVNRVLALTFPPPTTISIAPSSSICTSGSVTSATLSAVGATSYTWSPPSFPTSFIVVTPTTTSTYTLTGQTGTCVGTWTREITVNPTPTVNILTSNTSLCPGQVATLTALGANTYSWLPVGGSGSSITVSQTAATTYTAIGTSTTGCQATGTSNISMAIAPSVNIFYAGAPVICAGTSVTMVGFGASTFTWFPGGSTANPIVVAPFVTTTYTGIGASGTCTNMATYQVSVDPGPTLAVVSSPTLICPYNSATVSAFGASALGYTWMPSTVSTSMVVSPTITTTYSVHAINLLGCISEYTVAPIVAPVPVMTITPSTPTVCIGSTLNLSATGGSTYTWSPGPLTGSQVAVSPTANTVYNIVGSNGTCTSSINSSVTVVPLPTVSITSPTTSICAGQFISLSANGANNYTWLPGNSNATNIVVSPTITTTYTLIGNTAACDNFATITITVNPLPVLAPVASPTAICPGFSSTLSSTGATNYTWMPGTLTGSSTVVSPTITTVYTLTGASAFGCVSTKTVNLVVNPIPTVNVSSNTPSICAGFSAALSASGAVSYTWLPGPLAGSSVAVTPSATTLYTVAGSNSLGCISGNTINLIVVPNPTVTSAVNPTAICVGFNATLTANGATNYTWLPGAMTVSNPVVSPTVTTIYTVTGKTAGCTGTSTVQLIINNGPTITAAASPTAICPTFNSTLSASGAVSYTWNPGAVISNSTVVSPAATTVYSVTGASAFGCLTTNTLSLLVNPTPTINPSVNTPSICAGSSASLSATGAATYTWNPGALVGSTVSVSPANTTNYTVTGTSTAGCLGSNTINLIVVPNPTVTSAANPTAICVGFNATLTANGATNYTWLPGAMTLSNPVVSPTATTIYTVTGNTAGCTGTSTVQLIINNGPTITAAASPTAICPTFNSTLSASGAVAYTWNPGAVISNSTVVSPAATTVYSVTGASAFGCLTTNTLSLLVNPIPTINPSVNTPSICAGSSASLSATGAATYTWNPGALVGSTVSVSPANTTNYTVTGTSTAGCLGSNTINLIVVPNPTVTSAANPTAICVGFNATLTANGATNYTWLPGAMTVSNPVVSPTVTTIYTVTGNTAGCTGTSTVQLIINNGPTITAAASPTAICPTFNSTLSASGAVSYTWNPGAVISNSTVVSPAATTVYSVTGASAFGCLTTNTLSLLVNPIPTINPSVNTPSICAGSSASLSATGAATYTWNPGALVGSTVSVSPANTTNYTVTGTSTAGCLGSNTINLIVVPNPTVTSAANPTAICVGFNATLTANGATNYTWLPGAMTLSNPVVSPTVTTIYTVTGNTAGCTGTSTVQLIINNGPTITAAASPTAICPTFNSTLSASGAVSYTWNPGAVISNSTVVSPAATTVYSVTGASAFGCLTTSTLSLLVNPIPTINPSVNTPSICAGSSASLSATGAATYTWNPGALVGSTVSVFPANTTNYTVTGTSTAGCLGSNTINLIVVPNPTVTSAANPTAICVGFNATLTANGATNYTWLPGAMTVSNPVVSPTVTTIYTVTGNTAGCTGTSTVQLIINNGPTITAAASPTAICSTFNSTLSASGAVSYTWNPGAVISNSTVVSPAATTVYSVTGASAFGCLTTNTLSLLVNPTPTINPSVNTPSICAGSSASLSATGAATYTWNPGALVGSTVSVSPANTTNYTVTGTSTAGCLGSNTINLIVVPNPTVTSAANPTAICVGFNATLTANGATNYTWLPGAMTLSNPVVSPTVTTIYTVTGNTAGCTGTSTVQLIVNPSPTPGIVASSNTICSTFSSTLTASGAATYTWNPGGTIASSVSVSPNITTVYTANATSTAGCIGLNVFTLAVNPTPTIVPSPASATICVGGTATVSYTGATTYTLNPGIITGSQVALTPITNQTYTVTGTLGTCTSSILIPVTVNPVPTIVATSNPTNLCTGNSASLSATGAVTFTWLPVNQSGSLITVNPMTSQVYTVNGTNSFSCVSSKTLGLLVSPTPSMTASLSSTVTCAGGPATLTANGALNYTWQPGIVSGSSAVVNPTSTTTYTLYGDNGSICTQSITITLSVNPLPNPVVASTSSAICLGNSATLTASGGQTYTWTGIGNTQSISVNPTVTTNYTLTTTDANTCVNTTVFILPVNNNPTVTALASPTVICDGSTSTLSASGANTYSWLPVNSSGSAIAVSPSLSTNYTVTGIDLNGCVNTTTVDLSVLPNPVFSLAATNASICFGETNTLTANGAVNYTWLPGSANGNTISISPTITTIFTVVATNTTVCTSIQTITAFVNQLPANLTTSVSNLITCATPSTNLFASSTDTNVTYSWSGPSSFTSAVQNPTGVGVWGNFTVTVTNTLTGCIAETTASVLTDYSIPSLTLNTGYTITCAAPVVTLTTAHTTTNPAFLWTGPSNYSSALQSPTISAGGIYTIVATDISSGCFSSATVAVSVHTAVIASSSLSLPTCSAGISNNDGTIYAINFGATDRFAIIAGSTFTAAITYTNAAPIPTSGILTNTLANPSTTVAYTLRIFDLEGCFRDSTFIITPTDCEFHTLGIAKAVSEPVLNNDGSYNVNYTLTVKNYDQTNFNNIVITDNLQNTFPAPNLFTVTAGPETISGTGIIMNTGYNGKSQSTLSAAGSTLGAGASQSFSFTVRVQTPLYYQVFKNTALGTALNGAGATVKDSSNAGFDTSPLKNTPTPLTFTPSIRFGITKQASFVQTDSKSFDITYTIKVHNLSNDTLKNVVLRDSLEGVIKSPAAYTMLGAPLASGGLVANNLFGPSDANLINPASSRLDPGAVGEVMFTIHLIPDTVTVLVNSAYGSAQNIPLAQPGLSTSVSDVSNSGNNPDVDGNLICNEASDNLPTVLVLPPTYSLFIPEGFSPDGDGINDQFVIKGLPSEGNNSLTIFNRWGNRVYYHENYNDAIPWDGLPNVAGTFGQGRLPQGTYYYVLELKGPEKKVYTGFIVLQY